MEISLGRETKVGVSLPTRADVGVSLGLGLGAAAAIAAIRYAIVGPNGLVERAFGGGALVAGGALAARAIVMRQNRSYVVGGRVDLESLLYKSLDGLKSRNGTLVKAEVGSLYSVEDEAAFSSFSEKYLPWATGMAVWVSDREMESWRQVAGKLSQQGWTISTHRESVRGAHLMYDILDEWDRSKAAAAKTS